MRSLLAAFALPVAAASITVLTACGPVLDESDPIAARAARLMSEVPLIDGHNDLPWKYRALVKNDVDALDITKRDDRLHTDLPKIREGKLGGQFWSVYVPVSFEGAKAVEATMEQVDVVYRMIAKYPDRFGLALTADDIERQFKAGKVASLMGIEGGHCIDESLGTLRMFYRLGVRYMTLTHSKNTPWADSCTDDKQCDGLKDFGKQVVAEMNRLGMLVDISHVAPHTMHAVLDIAKAPVIFSHSSARGLCDHVRNVPDDVLGRLKENGGICMVTFVPTFLNEEVRRYGEQRGEERKRLERVHPGDENKSRREKELERWERVNPKPRASLKDAADHIDHIVKTAGVDHVGIGGDFDGISSVPVGLEDVSKYKDLIEELLRRGHDDAAIKKVLGENLLRVFRAVEARAAASATERRA